MGESLFLLPEKAIYWKEKKTLIFSDMHLGKASHFRKSGIQIPESVHISDYFRIKSLISRFRPDRVLILGDLFHSDLNLEWNHFNEWIREFKELKFFLVKGNHDILPEELYSLANLEVYESDLLLPPFSFSHHVVQPEKIYTLSGHVHPAVRIHGTAKQSLTLPCYYFTDSHGILPAFGNFTGLARIKPKENDDIFVILEDSVIKI
jgi:DNA ligase-associated metallophosphoesterase